MAALIGPLVGIATQLLGGKLGQDQQDWKKDALVNVFQLLQQFQGDNQQLAENSIGPARDNLLRLLAPLGEQLFGPEGQGDLTKFFEQLQARGGQLSPDMFQGQANIPGLEEHQNNLSSLQNQANNLYGSMEGILGTGGQDARLQGLFESLSNLGAGNTNEMRSLSDIGQRLLGQGGQTNLTMGMQDRALDALNTGGWGPFLQGLAQYGGKIGGIGEQLLESGGTTGDTKDLSQMGKMLASLGIDIAGKEALLPMDQRVNLARDAAGRQGKAAAETFRRKAITKGGGPGIISSGSQNDAMLEFQDMLLGNESDAISRALTDQQGLQLQQRGMGFQGAGTGLGALADAQGLSTQRMGLGSTLTGQGLNLLGNLQPQATDLQQVLGGLGLGAGNLENARMGQGADMLSQFLQTQGGSLRAAQDPIQAMFSNLFNAAGTSNQTMGLNQDMYKTLLNSMLGGGELGFRQQMGAQDLIGQNTSQQGQWLMNLLAPYMNATGGLAEIGQGFQSLQNTSIAGMPGLFASAPTGSPIGSALSKMGEGIGQAVDNSFKGGQPSSGGQSSNKPWYQG